MSELRIQTPDGDVLTFSAREPADRALPIEWFRLSVAMGDLAASANIYGGYTNTHPASLFSNMAAKWSGWVGELTWSSIEGECSLAATHDRHGHVTLRVVPRPDVGIDSWQVLAFFHLEPGSLERLSRAADEFFGAVG